MTASSESGLDCFNVVFTFHRAEQQSARTLLLLLMALEEGVETQYFLYYEDDESTIVIQDTLARFLKTKRATFTSIQRDETANRISIRNHTLFTAIQQHEHFLAIAPDCVMLQNQWAVPLHEAFLQRQQPFVGRLQRQQIGDRTLITHFSSGALYDGIALREIISEELFTVQNNNPWRSLIGADAPSPAETESFGFDLAQATVFNGNTVPYPYLVFARYCQELTGSDQALGWPIDWPTSVLESRGDLVAWADASVSTTDLVNTYLHQVPIMGNVQNDAARRAVLRAVESRRLGDRQSYPLGGVFECPTVVGDRPVDVPANEEVEPGGLRPDNSEPVSIEDLRGQFAGKRCFIIGNGPSLKQTDLTRLKGEYTFGLNRIYLNYPNMGFEPTFYCCVNTNVLTQFGHEIDQLNAIKFVKKQSANVLNNHWNTFFMQSQGAIRFHEDLKDLTWHEGWTVTYCAMQVAYHLGFEEVILVGVDHYFKDSGEPNKAVTATGEDANHFHPNYFGKGVVWQYPDLERSEESYTVAKQVFERDGRRILDATVGGHLQIFPKVDFDQVTAEAIAVQQKADTQTEVSFSVITPSYNQASYVQRHLDSIRQQSLQPSEHLIFDPGSTDGSLDIFKTYCHEVGYATLINEKDKGQTDALNKGFQRVTGDIIAWLNSDDYYFNPDVFRDVADIFNTRPDVDVVYGRGLFVDPQGETVREAFIQEDDQVLDLAFQHSVGILQPALFFRRRLVDTVGLLDLTYNFAFDYDYWIRLKQAGANFYFLDQVLACAVLHDESKTCSGRGTQYEETLASVKSHYGYVPVQWLNRYAEYLSDGMDGIVRHGANTSVQQKERKDELVAQLLKTWSADAEALGVLLNHRDHDPYQRTLKALRHHGILSTHRVVVTSFDSNYFNQGLNLIAGLHRTNGDRVDLIGIYDLGLTSFERAYLSRLNRVVVLDYPDEVRRLYPGYLSPKNYSYKCAAIAHSATLVQPGQQVLWIDAGVTPLEPLDAVFSRIAADEIFLINHDDTPIWPFFNINFTHPEALKRMEATPEEVLGEHLCSAMVGYKRDGAYQALIDDAYRLSQHEKVICWSKHLNRAVPASGSELADNGAATYRSQSNRQLHAEAVQQLYQEDAPTVQDLIQRFPYLGHRQDQSIYSILAARYHCPIQSAQKFCCSNAQSSWASKKNWESGGESAEIQKTVDTVDGIHDAAVTFHHRGIFNYLDGLKVNTDTSLKLALIGDGFDGSNADLNSQFEAIATLAMDDSYHHWEPQGWTPTYYACLNDSLTPVQAEEISRLLDTQDIQFFILRRQFLDYYPQFTNHPRVWIVENQVRRFPVLDSEPAIPATRATLVAALLGYRQIYLLGLNETESVSDRLSSQSRSILAWAALKKRLYNWSIAIKTCDAASTLPLFPSISFEKARVEPFTPMSYAVTQLIDPMGDIAGGYGREYQAHYDETEVVSHLLKDLPAGSVMVDVGAHHGSALRHFADRDWQVFACEPDPDNRQKLEQRINGRSNIKIDIRAVSDRPGQTLPFFTSEESTGISALSPFRESHSQRCEVTTTTVAELCTENSIRDIDFLKIDTEGYDLMVLKGVPWDKVRPRMIECEFEDFKTVPLGYTFDDLAQYLVEQGYTVLVSEWHPVIRYGIQHDWHRLSLYPCQLNDAKAWGNLIAFREPPDLAQVAQVVNTLVKLRSPQKPASSNPSSTHRTHQQGQQAMNVAQANGNGKAIMASTNGSGQVTPENVPQLVQAQAPIAEPLPPLDLPPAPTPGMRGLMARMGRYYSRWPLAVAVLAIGLNTAAVFDTPYRVAFSGGGTTLMLFLVGHAASKADYALEVGDRAQVGANLAHDNVNSTREILAQSQHDTQAGINRANRALNRTRAAMDQAKQTANLARQAQQSAKSALSIANTGVGKAEMAIGKADAASQSAQTSRDVALAAKDGLSDLTQWVETINKDVNDMTLAVDRMNKSNTSNFGLFQPFERQLTPEYLEHFVEYWLTALNLEMDRRALGYLAHRICLCEDSCSGRLATNVQDMLVRILVARSVQSRDLSILEIGSLFGINLGILYETCRDFFESIQLTAIDPLDGYYGERLTDTITHVPITRDVFYHNLRKLDVPKEDVTLLQGLSTDSKTLADAGLKQYNLLVIDGDHTYDGVKFDFDHYLSAVDVGGFIVFDDYSTEHWPEVAEFVDQEVKNNPYVEFVGSSWRTGVFKVVRRNLGPSL